MRSIFSYRSSPFNNFSGLYDENMVIIGTSVFKSKSRHFIASRCTACIKTIKSRGASRKRLPRAKVSLKCRMRIFDLCHVHHDFRYTLYSMITKVSISIYIFISIILQTLEGHESSVLKAEFLTRGMQIITASGDGLLKLWNIKTSECACTLEQHSSRVWALAGRCNFLIRYSIIIYNYITVSCLKYS